MTSNRHIAELLLAHQHQRSVPVLAGHLVDLARKLPDAPATISEFVVALVAGTPAFAMSPDAKRSAVSYAREIAELAGRRRVSVAKLLQRHEVEDHLRRFRLTWWGR